MPSATGSFTKHPQACEASGDTNANGSVDLDNYARFGVCLSGPGLGSECFDFDSDGDIDLLDFVAFQMNFTGN